MNVRPVAACALLLVAACQTQGRASRALPALRDEGETYLYLDPLPASASRLALAVESISAAPADGAPVPLEVVLGEVSSKTAGHQRLLAWGRLPPGEYRALLVKLKRATVATETGVADLLVPAEPTPVAVPLVVGRARATVLALRLLFAQPPGANQFTPDFTASVPRGGLAPITGYCSNPATASVTVFDKHARQVTAVFPVGAEPRGLALDALRNRLYVALAGEDQVEVLDLITGTDLGRVTLRTGDRPREVALTPDGNVLVVVNEGSNSASFVDAQSATEIARVQTGLEPTALLLDRSGRRAYVLNRRANSMTVIDVPNRSVVTTVPTDPDPVRAQLNRAGDRLYLVHGWSPYLNVLSLPDLRSLKRIHVGLGAGALKVDSRSDLVYVGKRDESLVQVFDPFSFLPVNSIELPGGTTWLTIDDTENALLALVPGQGSVAFVDLSRRRVVGSLDVGGEPYQVIVVAER